MSLKISKITQIDEGGINPKTELHEQPMWLLTFENGEERILGKPKMEEYLTKAYEKTVHHFKKRISILKQRSAIEPFIEEERRIIQWSVVFVDYDDVLLATKELCDKIYKGHQRKDEEKYVNLEEELKKKNKVAPQNPALFTDSKDVSYQKRETITTPEEKKELEEFRKKVMSEGVISHDY